MSLNITQVPDNFCYAPFINLVVLPNGFLSVCCATNSPTHLGRHISNYKNVDEIFNSPYFNNFRNRFIENKTTKNCLKSCLNREEVGVHTHRLRLEDYIQKTSYTKSNLIETPQILSLDISLGNFCNLDCTMCSPGYSTTWINTYEKKYSVEPEDKPSSLSIDDLRKLYPLLKKVRRIIIKGGEPLIHPLFREFITEISEQNPDIFSLRIITNLNYVPPYFIELSQRFKNIGLIVSVDGTEDL